MKNQWLGFVYAMNYLAQAAWAFVFTAGVIIGLGYLAMRWLSAGKWVLVVAIVVGVCGGLYSMLSYLIRMADHATGDESRQDKNKKSR